MRFYGGKIDPRLASTFDYVWNHNTNTIESRPDTVSHATFANDHKLPAVGANNQTPKQAGHVATLAHLRAQH
jgi:hypothetical protein